MLTGTELLRPGHLRHNYLSLCWGQTNGLLTGPKLGHTVAGVLAQISTFHISNTKRCQGTPATGSNTELQMHSKRSTQRTQLLMIASPIHGVVSEAAGICPWPSALTTDRTGGRHNNSFQQRILTQPPAQRNAEVKGNKSNLTGNCLLCAYPHGDSCRAGDKSKIYM